VTFSLTELGRVGWRDRENLAVLIIGIVGLVVFFITNSRMSQPVLSIGIVGNRNIRIAATIGFSCTLIFYGSVFILSLFFQKNLGLSPANTGWAFLPMMLCGAVATYNAGQLAIRYGVVNTVMTGAVICLAGLIWLSMVSPDWGTYRLVGPMVSIAVGTALAVPGLTNVVFSEASSRDAGSASAFFSCARQMGGVTGVAIFGAIVSTAASDRFIEALKIVCFLAGLLCVCWLLLGRFRLAK
jgi:DHA2 family methylenomycin A resistance protein-like MFS transporter